MHFVNFFLHFSWPVNFRKHLFNLSLLHPSLCLLFSYSISILINSLTLPFPSYLNTPQLLWTNQYVSPSSDLVPISSPGDLEWPSPLCFDSQHWMCSPNWSVHMYSSGSSTSVTEQEETFKGSGCPHSHHCLVVDTNEVLRN